MLHWIWFIAVGFVAGLLAKALVPGEKNEPQGFVLTTLLGIGGSLLVGFVLHDLLGWQTGKHFIGTVVGATMGAVVLILVVRKFSK